MDGSALIASIMISYLMERYSEEINAVIHDTWKEQTMSKVLIRLSDALKAIEELPNAYNGFSDTYDKAYIIGTLEEVPSADRSQGEWALTRTMKTNSCPEHWLRCSACGKFRVIKMGEGFPDYCENCGAYMKGADDEAD